MNFRPGKTLPPPPPSPRRSLSLIGTQGAIVPGLARASRSLPLTLTLSPAVNWNSAGLREGGSRRDAISAWILKKFLSLSLSRAGSLLARGETLEKGIVFNWQSPALARILSQREGGGGRARAFTFAGERKLIVSKTAKFSNAIRVPGGGGGRARERERERGKADNSFIVID